QAQGSALADYVETTFNTCSIQVTKTAPTDICAGTSVQYNYSVTNPNTIGISAILTDSLLGTVLGPINLGPGAVATAITSTTINITTTNIVTATGNILIGGTPVPIASAVATAVVNAHTCQISLDKVANPNLICIGGSTPVTYTYTIHNTGDFFDTSGDLYDDNGVPGGHNFVCNWGPIHPGESATCTQHVNLSQTTTNHAIATCTEGCGPGGATATAQAIVNAVP